MMTHRDAVETGMLQHHAVAAYRRPEGALDPNTWVPVGMESHYKAVAARLGDGLPVAAARDLALRRSRNTLRSAMWAFAAVPWVEELVIDRVEWDVMWSLTFG